MDWSYLFYFFLAGTIFFGAKSMGRGKWNEEYTSLQQTKILQGIAALGVALHHLAQKSCAPWHPQRFVVHGLDPFIPMGSMFVAVFLFCSGMGLYKSFKTKPDYLKGFFRKRILPIMIAFYLSEIIYTAVRLAMGEQMDALTVLWYLSGLHMANFNAWYVIVIPFFYLAFWAAFRFCKREGTAIFWVFVFTLGYTVFGAFIGRQNDWWMRGEWWYNSILLFPLGMVFAKHEEGITRVLKKGYWFFLLFFFAGFFLLFQQSEWLINFRLGYFGGGTQGVINRILSAGTQWAVAFFFVAVWFLLAMKIRFGNKLLVWLGAVSLDFYLMHGIFVELFGYNFLDIGKSIIYIKNVPLYVVAVLASSVPAVLAFSWIRIKITGLTQKKNGTTPGFTQQRKSLKDRMKEHREYAEAFGTSRIRRFLVPGLTVLALIAMFVILQTGMGGDGRVQIMKGMTFEAPEGFQLQRADSVSALWEYKEKDRKVGYLILNAEIPDANSRSQRTLEDVYAECDWLKEKEYYVNPQGVRMLRGLTDVSGTMERRYYIENTSGLLVLKMIENKEYFNLNDCEEMTQAMADSVKPGK